jgi:hypothetical protein
MALVLRHRGQTQFIPSITLLLRAAEAAVTTTLVAEAELEGMYLAH